MNDYIFTQEVDNIEPTGYKKCGYVAVKKIDGKLVIEHHFLKSMEDELRSSMNEKRHELLCRR